MSSYKEEKKQEEEEEEEEEEEKGILSKSLEREGRPHSISSFATAAIIISIIISV